MQLCAETLTYGRKNTFWPKEAVDGQDTSVPAPARITVRVPGLCPSVSQTVLESLEGAVRPYVPRNNLK